MEKSVLRVCWRSLFCVLQIAGILLMLMHIDASAQSSSSAVMGNPLNVVDFMAEMPGNGQSVLVEGKPYCLSSNDCLLYDKDVYNKFIYFDPTATLLSDRQQFVRCPLPIKGAGCLALLQGQASTDPTSITNVYVYSVKWIEGP